MKASVLIGFLFASGGFASAQYEIPWQTIGGGGGASSGDAYALAGTVGQAVAGGSTGGSYTLMAGFWSYAGAVRTESAPPLRIERAGRNIILAWPDPSAGFQLQATPGLSAPVWSNVGGTPVAIGSERQVTLPVQAGPQFFRLRRP